MIFSNKRRHDATTHQDQHSRTNRNGVRELRPARRNPDARNPEQKTRGDQEAASQGEASSATAFAASLTLPPLSLCCRFVGVFARESFPGEATAHYLADHEGEPLRV